MPTPTNLTDRISHLRERKSSSPVIRGDGSPPKKPGAPVLKHERKPANDFFMFFVYALLGVAMVSQLLLIALLDVV